MCNKSSVAEQQVAKQEDGNTVALCFPPVMQYQYDTTTEST